jgi:hypothetical protein
MLMLRRMTPHTSLEAVYGFDCVHGGWIHDAQAFDVVGSMREPAIPDEIRERMPKIAPTIAPTCAPTFA